jgi:hypothetical protein
MSVTWIVVVAVLVLGQKLLPARAAIDVPLALAIVAFGLLIMVEPSTVPGLTPPMRASHRWLHRSRTLWDMKGDSTMTGHRIGTRDVWVAARANLLIREKEHTRLGGELARQRRELPWMRRNDEYETK